ncbi:flagellar hook capping FlgD N-terminal domain-containing protein [Alcaligenaceae bacterium A4P071]|nr:flagellar hook capping FlgD N-terminal domain-containing protein [Alcaligenaceae bacterium B3P038]MDQ2149825.1 flagellar hook capping FlgD N-terminal domain-containing protein [Alcaligenaceae bacterium C4P045]MDQ2184156.1 flagellar hook capping FlgD N-terminal domain-containing protein [Alcaligenaceae bacterium A4P071]
MAVVTSSTDQNAAVAALAAQADAQRNTSTSSDMKDQFLKLLVEQLKNQDPLNPMDNAQMTTQLAQISTVEGIEKLNATMAIVSGQVGVSQGLAAQGMIGKNVFVPGTDVLLGSDPADPTKREATPIGLDLTTGAAKVTVKISDAAGNLVRTITLENVSAGIATVEWDGLTDGKTPAADGKYQVAVTAEDSAGAAIASTEVLKYAKVDSLSYTSTGATLDLGLNGQVSVADVRKVFGS